ncbi:hypothetical protein CCACVL1_07276 [Corchorus capsularis]|uniref:Uncharacterized protein n=1 Tax=Corchorus capsularis TaxID=210143 RepID=A0A1R3J7Q3_COCAP|nr:hypothetical protein CCACVL1_07276 [Corchorus capsularis]
MDEADILPEGKLGLMSTTSKSNLCN